MSWEVFLFPFLVVWVMGGLVYLGFFKTKMQKTEKEYEELASMK